ncbi:hypothetical protein AAHE18_16G273000 [Arachis hypogaea]
MIPKLPPGSMGWPYIGETLQLYSQDPNLFFFTKQKRYGEIFKSNILGCPCVMLTSPEAASLWSLSLQSLKILVPKIEALALSSIQNWAPHHNNNGHVVNTFKEMKRFSFDVGILTIFGYLEPHLKEELKNNYWIVDKGYNSFPSTIPGTQYQKALLARKKLGKILCEIICERKEKKLVDRDLLSCLLNWKGEGGETLNDDQIADNIIGVLFAAQDTTASVMTWIVKYLHDQPKLLQTVKAEQKAIQKSNEVDNLPLSWNQTRNMPITYKGSLYQKGGKQCHCSEIFITIQNFSLSLRNSTLQGLRLHQNPIHSCHLAVEYMPAPVMS